LECLTECRLAFDPFGLGVDIRESDFAKSSATLNQIVLRALDN
jgi:hypothetical protein